MPQLDPVTFFSQFFWLCFFFFTFYIAICKDFLPKMGRILKLRKKKINVSTQGVESMEQENEKVNASSKAIVENSLNTCSQFFSTQMQQMESWLKEAVSDVNTKQLRGSNQSYIQWIGVHCIGQQLALQAAGPINSPRVFASILTEKCKKREQLSNKDASSWEHTIRPESLDQPLTERKKKSVPQKERNSVNVDAGKKVRASKR